MHPQTSQSTWCCLRISGHIQAFNPFKSTWDYQHCAWRPFCTDRLLVDAAIHLCSEASHPRSMSIEVPLPLCALPACPSHLTEPSSAGRVALVSKLIFTHGSIDPVDAADLLHTSLSRIRVLRQISEQPFSSWRMGSLMRSVALRCAVCTKRMLSIEEHSRTSKHRVCNLPLKSTYPDA